MLREGDDLISEHRELGRRNQRVNQRQPQPVRGFLQIDAEKAFDKVFRHAICDNLLAKGINPTLVATIADLYRNAKLEVEGQAVNTTTGVL